MTPSVLGPVPNDDLSCCHAAAPPQPGSLPWQWPAQMVAASPTALGELLAVQPQQLGEECASFERQPQGEPALDIWIPFAAVWRAWKSLIPAALHSPPFPRVLTLPNPRGCREDALGAIAGPGLGRQAAGWSFRLWQNQSQSLVQRRRQEQSHIDPSAQKHLCVLLVVVSHARVCVMSAMQSTTPSLPRVIFVRGSLFCISTWCSMTLCL
jgi:hypothetical protein